MIEEVDVGAIIFVWSFEDDVNEIIEVEGFGKIVVNLLTSDVTDVVGIRLDDDGVVTIETAPLLDSEIVGIDGDDWIFIEVDGVTCIECEGGISK